MDGNIITLDRFQRWSVVSGQFVFNGWVVSEIQEPRGLLDALIDLGYGKHHRHLSPQQMSVI
jgi:hypothetical protein